MVTISGAMSAAQAQNYYENDYADQGAVQSEYYQEGEDVGEWVGRLAAEWGITGRMTKEQFYRAIEGQHPVSGKQLVKHIQARKYINKYGEEIETSTHRAGWDATFSCPKSLVILAYMSGDEELRKSIWEGHIASVMDALAEMEKYVGVRINKGKWEKSGKMLGAVFHHERARPDDTTGYAAPEIHTHVLIMNFSESEDGKVHAMQERELFKAQAYGTAIYRIRLAEQLQKRGIQLRVDRKTGAPEVAGITRDYIEAASVRSSEIKRKAREIQARMEAEGEQVKLGAGVNQVAAKLGRQGKNYDKAEMARRDAKLEENFDRQAHLMAAAVRERGPIFYAGEEIDERAREAVNYGVERAMEREAVADRRLILTDAMRRNMLCTTYDAITAEMQRRERAGELIEIERAERMSERTSKKMLNLELENLRKAAGGTAEHEAMAEADEGRKLIAEISYRQSIELNPDQFQAVIKLLGNRDRVVALQGRAGVGKTTVMRVLREAAERSGYAVCGIAPTTMAAKELAGSGIKSQTLQSFLSRPRQGDEGKRLIVLDESSLSDTKRINALFQRLEEGERILLVGDRDQHQAVEAGAPFGQIQRGGKIETVWIKQVVRQQEPSYRRTVEQLQEGKFHEAVGSLRAQGRIIEIDSEGDRIVALAERYVGQPEGTLAVVPGNRERVMANAVIHKMLQAKGVVDKQDHPTAILANRDMTVADRQWAAAYREEEDVIRYREGSAIYGIGKGEYARAVEVDAARNLLTVEFEDGRQTTYDPRRLYGVEVFRESVRKFSVGDRIQFRRPFERKAVNGDLAMIEKIEDGRFTVRTKDSVITLDTKKFRHFDHGYAVTSYLSQGQTAARTIVHIDTESSDVLVNRRMARVALTRGVHDVVIFTDSIDRLAEALERRKDKEIALDAVHESTRFQRAKEAGVDAEISAGARPAHPARDASTTSHPDHTLRKFSKRPRDRTFKRQVTRYEIPEREERTQHKLVRVKRGLPCPVCDHTDWCSISEDGAIAICMRTQSEYETRNGGWLHILDDPISMEKVKAMTVEVKQHVRAEIERRDAIFQDLLSALKLSERDRKNLLKRGLDEAVIERNGYKSVPSLASIDEVEGHFKERDLNGIPGFYKEEGVWRLNIGAWRDKSGIAHSFHQGFFIPVRDLQGRIEGFQIRRAEVKDDEPRYIWLSSSNKEDGASSGAPVHFRNPERARERGQAIITEGGLKGDTSAYLLGDRHCVMALAGVSNFRKEDFGQWLREQIPELRQVIIGFDADAERITEVREALKRLVESLTEAGLDVRALHWKESQGKGLDDYLWKDPEHRNNVEEFLSESLASLDRGEVSAAAQITKDRSKAQDQPQSTKHEVSL
jgi:conjugative relaxase-like TrwC/TraI family protein